MIIAAIIDVITTTVTMVTITIVLVPRIAIYFWTTVIRAIAIVAMIITTIVTICSFGTIIGMASLVLILLTFFDIKLKQWTASRHP